MEVNFKNTSLNKSSGQIIKDIISLNNDNETNLNKIKSLENSKENNNKYLNLKDSVKSEHILKNIFLYLDEKKKFLLIRYNKFYQKLLGINIELYKKLSGRIRIGEANGFGEELDLNSFNLKFKGYYINRKKNGKGKEYFGGKLIFEGEYINGKRNGKGKEYNNRGKLIFEGEFIDGKYWNGKLKEFYVNYDKSCVLKFEGEYLDGKRIGKEYYKDGGLLFEGEYLDDKRWNGIIYNKGKDCLFRIKNGNGKIKE